jgi:hypothetical protein
MVTWGKVVFDELRTPDSKIHKHIKALHDVR